MHLKRYRRETVQEALRAVREELGPNALVLATRMISTPGVRGWFGGRMVEVTAATGRPQLSDDRHRGPHADSRDTVTSDAGSLAGIARALDDARARVDASGAESVPHHAGASMTRGVAGIAARLEAAGLDPALAREVAGAHPLHKRRGATIESLRGTLAGQLAGLVAADDGYAAVEVFIGPPGVGKTTTIAKIAAQERARHGKRLGLIAADGFRVGAVEQLRLYADILGSPFAVARTPGELETALDKRRGSLLLDTAGRSASDGVSRDMFRLLASRPDVRTHLVLAADTPRDTACRVFDRFEDARPSRVVLTKLDEARSMAPLVPVLRERALPLSYLGTGQGVPDDLQRATAPVVAAWVAGEGMGNAPRAAGASTRTGARA